MMSIIVGMIREKPMCFKNLQIRRLLLLFILRVLQLQCLQINQALHRLQSSRRINIAHLWYFECGQHFTQALLSYSADSLALAQIAVFKLRVQAFR